MLHIVKLIERRHRNHASRIINALTLLSASALALGAGLLILN